MASVRSCLGSWFCWARMLAAAAANAMAILIIGVLRGPVVIFDAADYAATPVQRAEFIVTTIRNHLTRKSCTHHLDKFDAVSSVPEWTDLNPRLGASYNLFGNGRTALKASQDSTRFGLTLRPQLSSAMSCW